jgi:hypothetical protein
MGAFSGLNNYTTTGQVGVAIIAGVGGNLAFQDFLTDAESSTLQGYLTINGDLSKRKVELGTLPATRGSFSVAFPDGTDISLFNVVVVQTSETSIGMARIP